ncbi:MAG: c-type cytochrome [Pseudomonadota bacterium]
MYNYRCYFCHGYSGDAKTVAAGYLSPPPRDFTTRVLDRRRMIKAVSHGRPGTAMMAFKGVLKPDEIEAVVDFVRQAFMSRKEKNTRYHTPENGWPRHERYQAAFPFAQGEIPLDTPWESLTSAQREGRRLFMSGCVTCHEGSRSKDDKAPAEWDPRALSFPRGGYSHQQPPQKPDGISGASIYAKHDIPPKLANLTPQERQGETLFQKNCAFCHAADGTGRNWIGSFLQPHPRDLTSRTAMAGMTRERLRQVIRDGLPGTTMPAWKSVLTDEQIEAVMAYVGKAFHSASR